MRRVLTLFGLAIIGLASPLGAQSVAEGVRVAAFVDVYGAWDFSRPPSIDRAYTTQPARHAELNVNLAHVELRLDREAVRGRLALQAGTSVQSNYAVYQSTPSGETALFSVGKYADKIVIDGEAMRFKERIVVADTGAVKNLISSPI